MSKYFTSAYRFGILGGALSVVSFIVLSLIYGDATNLNLVFGYVITPISIFIAIKIFKEYANAGYLSFAEGMSVGFVCYMVLASISCAGIWLTLMFWPDLFQEIKTSKLDVLSNNKDSIVSQLGVESYDMTLKSLSNLSQWDIGFNDAIWKIIPGLFFTIIISIILRKNPN
ncbi:DUF4199 domain-containing protein [Algoriphagus halophytocola]|uniref:DUF4199 domain-containing protein n=1 Tax=Algoriphagus halophytocola TaxID=2991499 RepID=A0ABY6MM06_9BACT|nr:MULTISPECIES: DUF4199 domain-containing protein [unclassified Algoriphagus]UZD24693.1 DUF4199 domain-containing protein [Algoriphagus sp. TR-M5]WBL42061.1 DUF4199 domain-containing protein [Algoriphagus sp. TR-M9]